MKTKVSITLLALGFAGVAFAQAPSFSDVDANKDGKITQEEAAAVEGLDFTKADANQDGSLDQAEYQAATSGGSK